MIKLVLMLDEEKVFDGMVESIETETVSGPLMILPEHQPYLARVVNYIQYQESSKIKKFEFLRGFIYTNGNTCVAISDTN